MIDKQHWRAFLWALLAGVVGQIVLSVAADANPGVRKSLGYTSPVVSALAGSVYGFIGATWRGGAAKNGFIIGGIAGFVGIAMSVALGDLPGMVMLIGWVPAALAGSIGAALAGSSDLT